MSKLRLLRSYNQLADAPLADFGLHVAGKLDGNAAFPNLPFTVAALTAKANELSTSIGVAADGTKEDTAHKNAVRAELIAMLDTLAGYVEITAQNNEEKMLSSGFGLANTGRTPAVPGMTSILSVTNLATTKLGLELAVADNAWGYIVAISSAPGVWMMVNTFTDPHDVVLSGLTPGTVYAIRVQVIGSGNQRSEWCEPVSHMST